MNKFLLFALAASLASTGAMADKCYTYDSDIFGAARRVSPNGKWITGADDIDETGSFIINTDTPEKLTFTSEGMLLDIDDNGTAVGAWYEVVGYAKYQRAAVYKDGKWTRLPVPEFTIGQGGAVSISADSKIIGGYVMCENDNPDEPGKNFPITWQLNEETGDYEILRVYNNLSLPGTYGFFPYDMSPDAKYLCGIQGLDMGDYIGVVLDLTKGELLPFHEIEYKDRTSIATHPSTGEPIIFTDSVMHVDGLIDGFNPNVQFSGVFSYATDKYIFGSRDIVTDLQEDGTGKIKTCATIYDIENDKFIDGPTTYSYLCGANASLQFTTDGSYVYAGNKYSVDSDFNTGSVSVAGIYALDSEARVLSGSYLYYSPLGDVLEQPVVIILDQGLSSIQEVGSDPTFKADVTVDGGVITVSGASDVTIFSLSGSVLSHSHSVSVPTGVYIVIADGNSAKVVVK